MPKNKRQAKMAPNDIANGV